MGKLCCAEVLLATISMMESLTQTEISGISNHQLSWCDPPYLLQFRISIVEKVGKSKFHDGNVSEAVIFSNSGQQFKLKELIL